MCCILGRSLISFDVNSSKSFKLNDTTAPAVKRSSELTQRDIWHHSKSFPLIIKHLQKIFNSISNFVLTNSIVKFIEKIKKENQNKSFPCRFPAC